MRKRRKKEKDKDLYETVEEVFDYSTLMALYKLVNKRIIDRMYGFCKTGKESRVYWAKSPKGEDLAVKIYLITAAEFKKGIRKYIESDPRFEGVRGDFRRIIYAWARKEFINLKEAHVAGVNVPKPIAVEKNVLVMSFIGENGIPAPLLREYTPEDPELFWKEVFVGVKRLYAVANLVHTDLSEYNIMVFKEKPYFFDFGQALHKDSPMADEFLWRDVNNLRRYFVEELSLSLPDTEDLYLWVLGRKVIQELEEFFLSL